MNIKRNTASMQVARLISRRELVLQGNVVMLPKNTKTQKHTNTGGVGCVTSVTECDEGTPNSSEDVTKTQKHTNTRGVGCVTSVTKCDVSDEALVSSCELESSPSAETIPLFDIAPKQSTAAWDDDCPF